MEKLEGIAIANDDRRPHLNSLLMCKSLLNRDVQRSTDTETPTIRMLPDTCAIKIGGRSILDTGHELTYPVVEALASALQDNRLIIGTGGGARSRHVFSIGIDLGMPAGVLAELAQADALGNAHILGALLAPYGVVAIPPEIFGHLLPLFIRTVPGVIFTGVPPYKLWEHPPAIGRVPPHRSDTGCFLLAECFGSRNVTLVKDVDGLYDRDPKLDSGANFIDSISAEELRKRQLDSLPFDSILLDLLDRARLMTQFQIINGRKPELIKAALESKHVGTIVYANR